MTQKSKEITNSSILFKRIIGNISGGDNQTLLVCIGGLHGNEQAGYNALEYLISHLDKRLFNGHFVAIGGNLQALKEKKRYLQTDLNRIWLNDLIDNIPQDSEISEYEELRQLIEVLRVIPHDTYKRRILIDLHTTSAPNGAFVVRTTKTDDTLAKLLEVPVIMGLDKKLQGTAMTYMEQWNYETFAFEGGTIGKENSMNNLVMGVWRIMQTLQMTTQPIPNLEHTLGETIRSGVPNYLNCEYIHKVPENSTFIMKEGFGNFDSIEEGQLLAHQDGKEICSPYKGYILMPLYQNDGNDGFFIIK
ncbi:succinylglutamate desuccinylase [Bernardetia litoralis DSM 6794]|uniref:Succinylglutamate desuccinylase n=1 Tax=Bernardetia litoralis (strain ATCC 23117 / DSM 6794 / NBRC 15988 / NCIMB 1366 / Fx l1 / Sio-4) TaxID=880071 RepID=I4AQ04_BERLS|nr:succinylglutamate desuccinylase/aspartoacylase family protein [Bernardetia litoralis]AFM06039.1 succinylglutamate desuccinylase [Bernardetia litoralis DSM 6794]